MQCLGGQTCQLEEVQVAVANEKVSGVLFVLAKPLEHVRVRGVAQQGNNSCTIADSFVCEGRCNAR